jgi:hypothetical protein
MATRTKKHQFHVHALSPRGFRKTTFWSLLLAVLIVVSASALARATHNFGAALTDKPDVAIYILLKDQEVGSTTLLRESEDGLERDYLADTKDGPKLVRLKKGETEWYVALTEPLKR